MKKTHILVNNKKEIFERDKFIHIYVRNLGKDVVFKHLFDACDYDHQTGILGVNYVAYGIAKTRQWLNSSAVPYIEAFTDKENLEIQQDLQKRLCVSEMKRLIKANQEIRFHNKEYGIEGAGKSLGEAIETFIDNAVKSFVEDDIDPLSDKEDYREIYFYNVEDCEVYLPEKYVNKIWDDNFYDEISNILREERKIDEATKAEKVWEMKEER